MHFADAVCGLAGICWFVRVECGFAGVWAARLGCCYGGDCSFIVCVSFWVLVEFVLKWVGLDGFR